VDYSKLLDDEESPLKKMIKSDKIISVNIADSESILDCDGPNYVPSIDELGESSSEDVYTMLRNRRKDL